MLNPVAIATHAARAGFRGADLVTSVAVALAESGGNETRAGGLWNIGAGPPGTPASQAQKAFERHKSGGWDQWAAYRSNAYLLYVPLATAAAATADVAAIVKDPAGAAGNVVDAITDAIPGADMLGAAQGAVAIAYKAGAWLGDRHNLERVAQVVVGVGLIVASVVMLARPAIGAVSGGAVGMIAKPVLKGLKS